MRPARKSTREWQLFGEAVVISLDTSTGTSQEKVVYVSPPENIPDQEHSVVFKAGAVDRNTLHICTQTEVMSYDLGSWDQGQLISLPSFNDVHHVTPGTDGSRLVAVTGLDLVIEIDPDGIVLREWDVLGNEPFTGRFDRTTDYRKVPTTKPHAAHPNFVFVYGDEIWVTRFEQKDAICLTDRSRRIDIGVEHPHDGVVRGDLVYFTTVDGHVVVANLETLQVEDVIDLVAMTPDNVALGWARGLHVDDNSTIVVGFSKLRVTEFRQNVRWVKQRFGLLNSNTSLTTHVAAFHLGDRKMLWRHTLDQPRLDAVFSVLRPG